MCKSFTPKGDDMQFIYNQIQSLLKTGLGEKLSIDAGRITYNSQYDPGVPSEGYTTGGSRETVSIPDECMERARAHSATEFLSWLQSQQ